MVKKSDGTFDDSDEAKAQKLQSTQDDIDKENKKTSAITKLKELGLTDDEIKAIKEVV